MILLIGHAHDSHTLAVEYHLRNQGVEVVRIANPDLPTSGNLSFKIGNGQSANYTAAIKDINSHYKTHDLSNVKTVWYRRPLRVVLPDDMHLEDQPVAEQEFKDFVSSIWGTLGQSATWINPWHSHVPTENKGRQLVAAQKVGFSIPDTLMSTSPTEIRNFAKQHAKTGIIFKCFNSTSWGLPDGAKAVTPTTPITLDDLSDDYSLINCPGIYQTRQEKSYELRITMLGHYPVAAKIDALGTKKGQDDWRMSNNSDRHISPYELPNGLAERCAAVMDELDLAFGCIDMIVTPDGDYVFLEINQMGQFLWIETACPEIPMLDLFTQYLMRPERDFKPEKRAPLIHLADQYASPDYWSWCDIQKNSRPSPFETNSPKKKAVA